MLSLGHDSNVFVCAFVHLTAVCLSNAQEQLSIAQHLTSGSLSSSET